MSEFCIYAVRPKKFWLGLTLVLCVGLFWVGYRYIVNINQAEPRIAPRPIQAPVLPDLSKYDRYDSLLDLKMERDREHARAIERLQGILEKIGLSDQVRKEAEQELWRVTRVIGQEHELENLMKAKGFQESMVRMGESLITIIVSEQLQPEQARQIGQLASEVTTFNIQQIQIVEREAE